jgi:hypothetical protein
LRVKAAKLLVRAGGHDSVDAVLVGADQGGERLDADVEAGPLRTALERSLLASAHPGS